MPKNADLQPKTYPSPKGEGFTDPLSGTLNPSGNQGGEVLELPVRVIAKMQEESNIALAYMESVIGIEVRLVSQARNRRRRTVKELQLREQARRLRCRRIEVDPEQQVAAPSLIMAIRARCCRLPM